MKKIIALLIAAIIGLVLFIGVTYAAPKAEYRFSDQFFGGLLMYRPEGTELLKIVDLNNAVIRIVVHGEPWNCAKLVIETNDGRIIGPCVEDYKP